MQEGGPDGQHSAGPDHQRIPLPRQTRVSELRPAICKAASAVAAWSPWLQADISGLEAVQKRAVKDISGLKGATYSMRRN